MAAARIVIVSPALADANNGNWQTARRWQLLLRPLDARIVRQWPDAQASDADQLMLALHALRSADSIRAWAERTGLRAAAPNLVVVLTGTDLYGDIGQGSMGQQAQNICRRAAAPVGQHDAGTGAACRGTGTLHQATFRGGRTCVMRSRIASYFAGSFSA